MIPNSSLLNPSLSISSCPFGLIVNSNDNNAFERAIGTPSRGVGEKTLNKIRIFAEENDLPLFKATKKNAQ